MNVHFHLSLTVMLPLEVYLFTKFKVSLITLSFDIKQAILSHSHVHLIVNLCIYKFTQLHLDDFGFCMRLLTQAIGFSCGSFRAQLL